jgi:CHAD domain-containing protein
MTFALRAGEHPANGSRRILLAQLTTARQCVANDGRLTDKEIHNARKSIKRARATLRLLRPAIDDSIFKETNLALRDIARPLTRVRDARVLLDSLHSLRKHFREVAERVPTERLQNELERQRTRSRREIRVSSEAVEQLRRSLRTIEPRIKRWRLGADDWDLLAPALRRIYRNARRAYSKVGAGDRSDEGLHEWRKQVKHLWHALQILTPLRPGHIGELADQAHKLADYLGDDHDLAVLGAHVAGAGASEAETLTQLIAERRTDLQDRGIAIGERLLGLKPKRFTHEIESLWQQWQESAQT